VYSSLCGTSLIPRSIVVIVQLVLMTSVAKADASLTLILIKAIFIDPNQTDNRVKYESSFLTLTLRPLPVSFEQHCFNTNYIGLCVYVGTHKL